MRITIAAAVAALLVSTPMAQAAAAHDGGYTQPTALATAAHPMRAAHQASGVVSGAAWGRGLAYTGVRDDIGGPAGGFADQSPG